MVKQPLFIMWFKRDLRLRDNRALKMAIEATQAVPGARLLLLYVFEPSLLADPHYDLRHWRFVTESLSDLNQQLRQVGPATPLALSEWPTAPTADLRAASTREAGQIIIAQREVVELLTELTQTYALRGLYSHQETGLRLTYLRDQAVAAFCQQHGTAWHEFNQNGVIRRLTQRKEWRPRYYARMNQPQQHPDLAALANVALPTAALTPCLGPSLPAKWRQPAAGFQAGGEEEAHQWLNSFLTERVDHYIASLPNPLASRTGGSRLSPYLAWGCLSTRQVVQAQGRAAQAARAQRLSARATELSGFAHRLLAQSYFIQQFESDDRLEFENMNPAFNALEKNVNATHLAAWAAGRTGYPLVDACMRCLAQTGYVNFRMRALLLSFLTHHLFQDWKPGALHLARLFLDFEPGIHYSQMQMQSGMDYQPIVRMYNPVKQSREHDPEGTFIREWVPELAGCSARAIHEPWKMTAAVQQQVGVVIGRDYPAPLVDIVATGRVARTALYQFGRTGKELPAQ